MKRRDFIKITGLGLAGAALSGFSKNRSENKEKINIIKRSDWDESWIKKDKLCVGLIERYRRELGQKYSYYIGDKLRSDFVTTVRYGECKSNDFESLEKFYRRIVVHHTAIDEEKYAGKNSTDQMRFLLNSMLYSGFGDLAYNFAIAPDGQIFEGCPLNYLSFHSGHTQETRDELGVKNPKDFAKSVFKEKDKAKKQAKTDQYKKAMQKDPDYGSVGIVLLGDLDNKEPTGAQLESLRKLLNHLKGALYIPKSNIIGHREVKEKVVEASGLTLTSDRDKICPGKNFTSKEFEELVCKLNEDTQKAEAKSILL